MKQIWALAAKDLRILLRDKAGLFFAFFFPVLFAVFFGSLFGGGGGGDGEGSPTRIAVVDLDRTEASEAFVRSLDEEEQLEVTAHATRVEAEDLVRAGDRAAFLVITEGFGDGGISMFQGNPIRLVVGVDPSRKAEGGLIQGMIMGKAYERVQAMFMEPESASQLAKDAIEAVDEADDISPLQRTILKGFLGSLDTFMTQMPEAGGFGGEEGDAAFNPIEIETADVAADDDGEGPSPYAISFPQGIIWGIMGCSAAFGISLVTERNRGTLTRLRTSPMSRSRLLLGKGLACFIATVGVATMLLLILRLGFGVSPRSLPLTVLAIVSTAIAFVGIMMLLSTIGKTEAAAGGIGWSVLVVMAMFGGGMIPLFLMRGWMVTLSHLSPIKWSILALEGGIWRGFTPGEMALPCLVLIGIGVGGFAIGSRVFDWTERG